MPNPRFAIYFVPPPGSLLAEFGAVVLGYDAEQGAMVAQLALSGIARTEQLEMTRDPARYGFHATLKAPFVLAPGRSDAELISAMDEFAGRRASVAMGRLSVAELGAFLALKPIDAADSVGALAAACVETFDPFRAQLSEQERGRRQAAGLSERQEELLARWGYPYVFDQFRFHMTLAGPLPEERRNAWRAALTAAFAKLADDAWTIDSISLVRQAEPAAHFQVVHRSSLKG